MCSCIALLAHTDIDTHTHTHKLMAAGIIPVPLQLITCIITFLSCPNGTDVLIPGQSGS